MRRTPRQYAAVLSDAMNAKGGAPQTIARQFIALLARDGALKKFDAIGRAFAAAWDRAHGETAVTVTTARPVAKATVTAIADTVAEHTGTRVQAVTAVDPAVIGGAVLQWGDTVLDGSVRRQLAELRKKLAAS